jgi:fluoroquinolone transport system permease protein
MTQHLKLFRTLFLNDFRFQLRYGFWLLYAFFTLFYVAVIRILPAGWQPDAAVICIQSDPALIGIYFMGALMLFEKSQHILDTLTVSPVTVRTYVFAKASALSVFAVLISAAIALFSGVHISSLPVRSFPAILFRAVLFCVSVFLTSSFFSFIAVCIASASESLNRFLIATVPVELCGILPVLVYLFSKGSMAQRVLSFHPGALCIDILRSASCSGRSLTGAELFLRTGLLVLWNIPAALAAERCMKRTFRSPGNGESAGAAI